MGSVVGAVLAAAAAAAAPGAVLTAEPPDAMAALPAGEYEPLYRSSDADPKSAGVSSLVSVEPFYLDVRAVTNREFLGFVADNPKWRRSAIKPVFADSHYLGHWAGDLELGPGADPGAPVVNVSWFAAKSYCKHVGKRLPTVDEWEYAARASETEADGSLDQGFRDRILEWYAMPADEPAVNLGGFRNVYGVYDMHGVIWEWTRDFNTALVSGESRADSGLDRQLFCGSGSVGSSDFKDYTGFMRFGFRSSLEGNYTVGSLGFRCACGPECGVALAD